MSDGILSDRRKALEDQFFQRQDQELLRRLKQTSERQQISEITGITDAAALDAISDAGIGAETLAAIGIVPLVAVAWADGRLESNERRAVLHAARDAGLGQDSPAHAILDRWLEARPGSHLLEAWKGYVAALSPEVRQALRADVLGRARRIAEAAGGFLGLGNKVSKDEERVLDELERSFS